LRAAKAKGIKMGAETKRPVLLRGALENEQNEASSKRFAT
jgi:hypothetical protein